MRIKSILAIACVVLAVFIYRQGNEPIVPPPRKTEPTLCQSPPLSEEQIKRLLELRAGSSLQSVLLITNGIVPWCKTQLSVRAGATTEVLTYTSPSGRLSISVENGQLIDTPQLK
jgi:hypothetical protein